MALGWAMLNNTRGTSLSEGRTGKSTVGVAVTRPDAYKPHGNRQCLVIYHAPIKKAGVGAPAFFVDH